MTDPQTSSSTDSPDTAVVVPCYNEADRLDRESFEAFAQTHPDIRFVLVNDGSKDQTSSLIHAMAEAAPESFQAIDLEKNSGKAEAVRQGMQAALNDEHPPRHIAFWDADLATPLDDILDFRQILMTSERFEMVFGSRVNLLGRSVNRNLARHYIGRIFATLANIVIRLPIYDTQCGAKMFRATPELGKVLKHPFLSRWIFDVEILARYLVLRNNTDQTPVRDIICERPLMTWTDVAGSKIKSTDFMTVGLDLFRIWKAYFVGTPARDRIDVES